MHFVGSLGWMPGLMCVFACVISGRYVCMCVHMHVRICMMFNRSIDCVLPVYVCQSVRMHVHTYVPTSTDIRTYVRTHVCTCGCTDQTTPSTGSSLSVSCVHTYVLMFVHADVQARQPSTVSSLFMSDSRYVRTHGHTYDDGHACTSMHDVHDDDEDDEVELRDTAMPAHGARMMMVITIVSPVTPS